MTSDNDTETNRTGPMTNPSLQECMEFIERETVALVNLGAMSLHQQKTINLAHKPLWEVIRVWGIK